MGFSAARIWADGQVYVPYNTEYFKTDGPYVILPWEQSYLLEKKPDLILWADVYRNDKGEILVKPWADFGKLKAELPKDPSEARPLLRDLLSRLPEVRWIIQCDDNVHDIHLGLSKILEETKSLDRVIIQSNYNPIMEAIKEIHPTALYGSSIADITRLKTFYSMWLLPAASLKSDILFTPLKYLNRDTVNSDIVFEAKRRFRKVFLGPLRTPEELKQAQDLKADGFFLADPFLLGPGGYQ
jgi:hypothetical protein